MTIHDRQIDAQVIAPRLATVVGFSATGGCLMVLNEDGTAIEGQLLHTAEHFPVCLVEGDTVLVYLLPGKGSVILGRVGSDARAKSESTPEHLLLDATRSLTLQCGEGSITLRGDGKVLIKGTNLVSKAENANRILGASVAVN